MKPKNKDTEQTNTIVRVKAKNYVCIPSEIFRDETVTIKERGLYATIMALPDDWNFTVKGLVTILSEGEDAIRTALRGLVHHGYVTHDRIFGDKGRILGTKWTIFDHKIAFKKTGQEKPQGDKPDVESPRGENPHVEKPREENPSQFKNTINQLSINTHTHTEDACASEEGVEKVSTGKWKQVLDTWMAKNCPEMFMRMEGVTDAQAHEMLQDDRANMTQLLTEINDKAIEYDGKKIYSTYVKFRNCQYKNNKAVQQQKQKPAPQQTAPRRTNIDTQTAEEAERAKAIREYREKLMAQNNGQDKQ